MEQELLLEMLDIALDYLNEKEACYYCVHRNYPSDCSHTDDGCKEGIFNGIQQMAEKNLREKKNAIIRNDAA